MKANLYELKQRNVVKPDKRNEILNNGADNAYPTRVERLILGSVTAKSAASMYASFLVGDGFANESLNKIVVGEMNYKPITLYKLLEKVAHSVAYQQGLYLHCNIGFDGAKYYINEINPLPFKHCRLGSPDDVNYSGKVAIYDNWDKQKGGGIQASKVNRVDVFNFTPSVIEAQVNKAGGWEKYKGQVFWHFFDDEYIYPLSLVDVVQDDADTELQISQFKNGELNGNLFAKYILRHAYFESETEKAEFLHRIAQFQGSKNNGSIMVIEDDITQDALGEVKDNGLKFEKIEQNVNDKLFIDWEQSTANNIRKAFKAIPPVLIDYTEGKLGNTSGTALVEAAKFYNEMTKKDRAIISQVFQELFSKFKTPINDSFEIKPLTFL